MTIRWIPAYIAVDAKNEPVGVLYPETRHSPFPKAQTATRGAQGLQTLPMKSIRLTPTQEQIKRAYNV